MKDDIISQTREGQGEGFPQSVCGASDEGEGGHIPIINALTPFPLPLGEGYLRKKFETKNQMFAGRSARRRMK